MPEIPMEETLAMRLEAASHSMLGKGHRRLVVD